MVVICNIINYYSDHFPLFASLLQRPKQCHSSYLQGRRAVPSFTPHVRGVQNCGQKIPLEPTLPPMTRPPCHQWMPKTLTWLIDQRAALRCNPQHNMNVARKLTKSVKTYLLV